MSIGTWEPHWIGDSTNHRYAALHRPESIGVRFGVLCVPPLLHEMPRSRRLVAEVASTLAGQGIPCLRFDYLGTGDASGDGSIVDFASIQDDIHLAELALRALARIDRVVVLAWRGSALPLADWLRAGAAPAKVVLWEPIVNGSDWLIRLQNEDDAERASRRPYALRRSGQLAPYDDQLMGFPISPKFRKDIAAASLGSLEWNRNVPVWAILRGESRLQQDPWQRVFNLPMNSPEFGGAATVDATMFLSSEVERIVDEVGQALRCEDGP